MTEYPSETMTPKERYEYRKAVRKEQRQAGNGSRLSSDQEADMTDMLDRFVTSVERIAEAMETREARDVEEARETEYKEEEGSTPEPEPLEWHQDETQDAGEYAFGKNGRYEIEIRTDKHILNYIRRGDSMRFRLHKSYDVNILKMKAAIREAAIA